MVSCHDSSLMLALLTRRKCYFMCILSLSRELFHLRMLCYTMCMLANEPAHARAHTNTPVLAHFAVALLALAFALILALTLAHSITFTAHSPAICLTHACALPPSLLPLLLSPFFTRSLSPTHTYALSHARKNKSTYQRFSNQKEGEASLKPHVTCAMHMPFLASHTRHTTMRRRERTRERGGVGMGGGGGGDRETERDRARAREREKERERERKSNWQRERGREAANARCTHVIHCHNMARGDGTSR